MSNFNSTPEINRKKEHKVPTHQKWILCKLGPIFWRIKHISPLFAVFSMYFLMHKMCPSSFNTYFFMDGYFIVSTYGYQIHMGTIMSWHWISKIVFWHFYVKGMSSVTSSVTYWNANKIMFTNFMPTLNGTPLNLRSLSRSNEKHPPTKCNCWTS